jgi:hypothetical protein
VVVQTVIRERRSVDLLNLGEVLVGARAGEEFELHFFHPPMLAGTWPNVKPRQVGEFGRSIGPRECSVTMARRWV